MKYTVAILIILLIATNMFWLYNTLDKGITADHSRSAKAQSDKTVETLLMLNNLLALGQDYESVATKLEAEFVSSLIKRKSNAIVVDSIVLVFNERLLSAVKLLSDLSTQEYEKLEK